MLEGKILLVEDNENDVILALRAFKRNNILNEVIVAKDGEEALDLLFGNQDNDVLMPALVLLDLKMPKLSGLDVLKRMRNHSSTKNLPVVILTTSNEEDDIVRSYNFGANSYIRKPVDFEGLVEAVGQLGLYWLVLNQPLPEAKERIK